MIWAELVFYLAVSATHPSRVHCKKCNFWPEIRFLSIRDFSQILMRFFSMRFFSYVYEIFLNL